MLILAMAGYHDTSMQLHNVNKMYFKLFKTLQILKVATNETTAICYRIALENYNNNDQHFYRPQ